MNVRHASRGAHWETVNSGDATEGSRLYYTPSMCRLSTNDNVRSRTESIQAYNRPALSPKSTYFQVHSLRHVSRISGVHC